MRAMPKSVTFARPSPFRRTFCGLTSRWIKPTLVREGERPARLERELEREIDRERPLAIDQVLERLTRDVLEDDELVPVLLAAIDDRDDPGMAEARGGARLTAEALDVLLVVRVAVVEDLERDHALEQPVVGAVDVRHTADPDQLLELVSSSNDFADHGEGHFPCCWLRKHG